MKTHIRMIIASAIVIALALTAVSGITYSWFSDVETTKINVNTASMDLKVSIDSTGVKNDADDLGTKVNFSYVESDGGEVLVDDSGKAIVNASSFGITNLCASSKIEIPYTISYKSSIKTVTHVTANPVFTFDEDHEHFDFNGITFGFNGTEIAFKDEDFDYTDYEIGGKLYYQFSAELDLLPWKVNVATGEDYVDLTNSSIIIKTTEDFNLPDFTFKIDLISEIYQSNYLTTYDTNVDEDCDVPDNKVVVLKKITASDDDNNVTFTDVLLDFSATDDVTKFCIPPMDFSISDGKIRMCIYPTPSIETENVTISFYYDGDASNLSVYDEDYNNITNDAVITKECSDEGSYLRLKLQLYTPIYLGGLFDTSEDGTEE